MKILYVLKHNPWGIGGGCYACRNYLQLFSTMFADDKIDACICEEYLNDADVSEYPNVCFIPVKQRSKLSKVLTPINGQLHRHYHQAIQLMKQNKYDYCIFDENGIAGSLVKEARKQGIKTIVINHNCQYEYSRDNMTSFLEKLLILPVVVRCERKSYKLCDYNIFLTEEDQIIFGNRYGKSNTKGVVGGCFYPKDLNLSSKKEIKPFRKEHLKMVISGTMGNVQNMDGINYFLDELLPLVPEDIHIVLAGKNPPASLLERIKPMSPRVIVIPNPKDMDSIVQDCDIFLCPARLGGGMKLRVMDGFRNGLPVLTHAVSARGYRQFEKEGMMAEFTTSTQYSSELSEMILKITNGDISKQNIIDKSLDSFSFINVLNRMKKYFCYEKR